jgi:hypothetical protein
MVAAGIFAGAGPKGYGRTSRRPEQSGGFALRFLLGLCLLYGTVWVLQALWRAS